MFLSKTRIALAALAVTGTLGTTSAPASAPVPVSQSVQRFAAIALQKTAAHLHVQAGHHATFHLTITNPHSITATDTMVCDTLPAHTHLVFSSAPDSFTGGSECIKTGDLTADAHNSFTLILKVDSNAHGQKIVNHAVATASNAHPVHATAFIVVPVHHAAAVRAPVAG
jgi:uncharacterized repeat protein (TIGR01451 family)